MSPRPPRPGAGDAPPDESLTPVDLWPPPDTEPSGRDCRLNYGGRRRGGKRARKRKEEEEGKSSCDGIAAEGKNRGEYGAESEGGGGGRRESPPPHPIMSSVFTSSSQRAGWPANAPHSSGDRPGRRRSGPRRGDGESLSFIE